MPAVNVRTRNSPIRPYTRNIQQINGFYVHSSPPKVVQMNPSMIRQWLRGGELAQLEQVVLEGQGHKLIGEYSPDPKVRNFLKTIPNYLAKIAELHDAVNKGDLKRLTSAMSSREPGMKNISLCKDFSGAGLLHKAVYNDHMNVVQWLIEKYPETVKLKDRDGKTALHYCGASGDREEMWRALVGAGADPNVVDSRGRTAAFYMEKPGAIELPEPKVPSGSLKRFTSGKEGLVVKPSNIRIWIHDRDLGRLQQVLWEGYGNKLKTETSNNPRVKRFLDSIPYAMNAIKDVHAAVVNDDYEEFEKKTSDPVPIQILSSKDVNGLNPLHKAAGLGRQKMVEDILERNQKLVFSTDHEGRTPLHYAAWLKNNDYIYTFLVENGADEMAFDNNGKLPSYYKVSSREPLGGLLSVIPEAPRTSVTFPPSWDWNILHPSARSTQNIHQLANKGLEADQKSISSYDLNGLHPSLTEIKPDFLEERPRFLKEVEERVVKVEQKIFENDDVKPAEKQVENVTEDETREEEHIRAETQESESEAVEEVEVVKDPEPEDKPEENIAENSPIKNDEPEDIVTETPGAVEEPEDNTTETSPDKVEEADASEDNGQTEKQEITWYNEGNPVHLQDTPEDNLVEESHDEKTEREIAEERQRMMDEGLIKVEDEEEEESEDDKEINEIIQNGDMQSLATLVLEGEGERLLGKKSENSEIQGFLDNVPSYIAKIKAVHKAARAGELRDLQAALDRRRFAVAKDGANPMGVTPLHVAVLFGRTQIIKYLGGRFPETLNAKDKKGRTPLHYAASVADNGHYFNILLNLGADRKMKDMAGNVPGYYIENPGLLTQEILLQEFNAPAQIAREMLSDKVERDDVSSRRLLQDPEFVDMLNECYKIIENAREKGSNLPLVNALTKELFDKVKLRITRNDKNLLDVIWPGIRVLQRGDEEQEEVDAEEEAIVPYYEPYLAFEDLLMPSAKNMHNLGRKINFQATAYLRKLPNLEITLDTENGGIIAPDTESYRVFEEVMITVVKEIQDIRVMDPQPESCFFPGYDFETETRKEGLLDKTRKTVGKMMRRLKNEVTPVFDEDIPSEYNKGVRSSTFVSARERIHSGIQERIQEIKLDEYERSKTAAVPVWNNNASNDVSITIVNPDDETVEIIIEEYPITEEMKWIDCLDPTAKYVLSARVECTRNLESYQLPGMLREEDLELIEMKLRSALKYQSVFEKMSGGRVRKESTEEEEYYTVEEVLYKSKLTAQLSARDLLLPLPYDKNSDHCRLLHGNYWPAHRGVHVSEDRNLAAWINVQDHLRILACTAMESPGHLLKVYTRVGRLVTSLDKHLTPKRSEALGFLTSRPSCLGNGLRFHVFVRLPRLAREGRLLLHDFCRVHSLTVHPTKESNVVFKIGNRQCLGIYEHESYQVFSSSIVKLVELEKSLSQEKSKQVAGLIKSILGMRKRGDKEIRLEQKTL